MSVIPLLLFTNNIQRYFIFISYYLSQCLFLGEEALAAQAVARTAQAEASKAIIAKDAAEKQLNEFRTRLAAAENAQDKLDALIVSIIF